MMACTRIPDRMKVVRWRAYAKSVLEPQVFERRVTALAVGLDMTVYSSSPTGNISRWSAARGALESAPVQAPVFGLAMMATALAVGSDGKMYAGTWGGAIQVWPGANGALLQTLARHTEGASKVNVIVIGLNGNVYSASTNNDSSHHTVQVWSGVNGAHLYSLRVSDIRDGSMGQVTALAIGTNGNIYSGSDDDTIVMWSGENGSRLRPLVGNKCGVTSLAVGLDGKVYSGSKDKCVRVWSSGYGALIQTLKGHTDGVCALAIGPVGEVLSGSDDGTIRV
jgi:WD40 repeat protein